MKWLSVVSVCALCAGCADTILTTEEERVLKTKAETTLFITSKSNENNALGRAAIRADALASAYFAAGIKTSRAQDALSAGVILAAGSVAIGALGGVSDRVLSNRAIAGVGLQTVGQRGVPKTKVEAIFKAAKQMNCIAGIADIYSTATDAKISNDATAENLTYAAMQDVRISARNAFVGDVQSFSAALGAFTDAVQSNEADLTESGRAGRRASQGTITEFEAYATKLGKCLE